MTLYKNTLSSIISKYAGTISSRQYFKLFICGFKYQQDMHGSIYFLYLHVKIIALQTFKNHAKCKLESNL